MIPIEHITDDDYRVAGLPPVIKPVEWKMVVMGNRYTPPVPSIVRIEDIQSRYTDSGDIEYKFMPSRGGNKPTIGDNHQNVVK